jgi:ATP-binding cassette subfamily B protein
MGGLVVNLAYLKRGFKPLQDFAKYTGRLSKASAAADRISEILHETPAVSDRQHATPAPALLGRIEFADVSFEYTEGCRILNDISFAIEPGRRIAVVGESGAGKSTLLALICRLHDPGSGCIRIDGTDIREWKVESLRAQLNIVMQDNAVFATTARENISLLRNDAPNDAIIHAAKLSGAHDFILRLPDGYDTQLGERGTTLSRGQIQRIAIARAALQSAPILLFDEPTSGLDEANERMVGDAILRASQGRTTLIVTHQLSLASRADQILVLKDGHIVESGSHDRLLSNDGVYAAMYQNQSSQWSANSNKRMLIGS